MSQNHTHNLITYLISYRMMKVLNDAKLCLTPDALVRWVSPLPLITTPFSQLTTPTCPSHRFSERVFDLVNLAALSSQPQALIGWIRNNPGTTRLLPIHQTRCFLRLVIWAGSCIVWAGSCIIWAGSCMIIMNKFKRMYVYMS